MSGEDVWRGRRGGGVGRGIYSAVEFLVPQMASSITISY